jgi:hypothetical protein
MLAAPCLFVWTLPTHQVRRAEYKNMFIQDGQIKRQKNFEHKGPRALLNICQLSNPSQYILVGHYLYTTAHFLIPKESFPNG